MIVFVSVQQLYGSSSIFAIMECNVCKTITQASFGIAFQRDFSNWTNFFQIGFKLAVTMDSGKLEMQMLVESTNSVLSIDAVDFTANLSVEFT